MIEALEARRFLAATYYVSATGNDTADGRSTATAWKTIARVNGKDFNPGDRVLFQGGKTFTVSGAAGSNVIANGGFESLANWADRMGTAASAATISKTAGLYHSGTGAIRLAGSADVYRAQNITGKVRASQAYLMSAWTKTWDAGNGNRGVGITFSKAGKEIGSFYRGFRGSYWAQTQWEFVAPPSFDKAVVWVLKSGDNSQFYVDDVSLKSIPNGVTLDASDAGTSTNPVTVGSWGSGRATIDAKDGIGLWVGNAGGISVNNINFTGSWNASTGSGGNAGVGIGFVNTLDSITKLNFLRVANVDVKGFRWGGVRISGWNDKSGYKDVRITDVSAHDNGDVGVLVEGEYSLTSNLYSNENVYIARVKAYNNTGIRDKGNNSGNGILIGDTKNGTIEQCVAYNNGRFNNFPGGGPVGIWAWDSDRVTIQYNESYANKTGSTKDGGGFDLDGGLTNSVMQYNYSHDNDGPGFLLCTFNGARKWANNAVRYNISQNDARKNGYGAITFTGGSGIGNTIVEHNTVYISKPSSGSPTAVRVTSAGSAVHVRNNILQTTGGVALVHSDSESTKVQFNGNAYWASGSAFRIEWGDDVYSSIAQFRSGTGMEKNGSATMGMSMDPKLSAAGKAPTLNDASKLTSLTHYKLASSSPLINLATSLTAPFKGYVSVSKDFFGRTITTRRDVGAAEYA